MEENKFHEPTKFDKAWDKAEDILLPFIVPFFAGAGDLIVLFSIIYCIVVGIPWYWCIMILLITVPVLIPFNRQLLDTLNNLIKDRGRKRQTTTPSDDNPMQQS